MGLCFGGLGGSVERDFDPNASAFACLPRDGEFAAEQSGPFAHAQEPDRFRV